MFHRCFILKHHQAKFSVAPFRKHPVRTACARRSVRNDSRWLSLGADVVTYDGANWVKQVSPTTADLRSVWGDQTRVFAVGDLGTIATAVSGGGFTTIASGTNERLGGVWGADGKFIAAATNGVLSRFDGLSWTADATGSGTKNGLLAVRGTGAINDNLWVSGEGGALLQFNGTTWVNSTKGSAPTIRSIMGFSNKEIWAVGDAGTILKYDGTSWSSQAPANLTTDLTGIWGSNARDLWVVGAGATILRYTGTGFTPRPAPVGTGDIKGVIGTGGGGDVWLVGSSTTAGSSTFLHGTTTMTYSFTLPFPSLEAVWGLGADSLWVAGTNTILNVAPVAGDNTKVSYTTYNGIVGNYRTIWGSGIFDVWFGADSGLLRHFTSAGLLTEQPFTTANIYSIWGSDLTNIYAVGDAGTMFRFDGTQWSPVNSGTRNRLNSIWGRSATDVWAAGTFGSVLHSAQK